MTDKLNSASPESVSVSERTQMTEIIWTCKVGGVTASNLPCEADHPMRQAIQHAFYDVAGCWPDFTFSGWAGSLTEGERAVVENRAPRPHDDPAQLTKDEARALAEGWDGKNFHSRQAFQAAFDSAFTKLRGIANG